MHEAPPADPSGSGPAAGPVPRVSIGVPVHNGSVYLGECLASLLAQDFEDFEIIVSDNGSTDGTQAICRAFAARDARIRYLRHPENRGAAWNFSRLPRLARGEYFRWHCHDDTCDPTQLGTCVRALDAAPDSVVLVYTGTTLIDGDGRVIRQQGEGLDTVGKPPHARCAQIASHLGYSNVLYGLARRRALLRTGLLGTYANADYVLISELGLLGEFRELPGHQFRRRVHSGMSRRANTTQEDVAAWFDTANRGHRVYFPELRMLRELNAAVMRAPLGWPEKLLTLWTVPRHWVRRRRWLIARELLAPMVPRFRRYA